MRPWLVIGAGAILLAAALIIEAPATLLDRRVADLTDGRIRIAAATGTVWRGAGELTLLPDGVRIPIAWRLEPMPLLRGVLAGSSWEGIWPSTIPPPNPPVASGSGAGRGHPACIPSIER